MSNLIGMDSAEVRSLANNIRTQANRINSVIGSVDGLVHQLASEWSGPDATEFVGWWQSKHRPALVAVESAVAGLAQSADNRAHAQDEASGATGSGSSAGTAKSVGITSGGVAGGIGAGAAGAAAATTAVGVAGAGAAGGGGGGDSASLSQQSQFQSGVVETANGQIKSTNQSLYDSSTGETVGGAWCASFATWVLKQNGYTTLPAGADSVNSWLTAAQNNQNGLSITTTPQPGDLVVYSYAPAAGGPFTASHIGIMTSDVSAGNFSAVSGNFDVNGTPQVAPTNPGDAYSIDGATYSSYLGEWVKPAFIHVGQ